MEDENWLFKAGPRLLHPAALIYFVELAGLTMDGHFLSNRLADRLIWDGKEWRCLLPLLGTMRWDSNC